MAGRRWRTSFSLRSVPEPLPELENAVLLEDLSPDRKVDPSLIRALRRYATRTFEVQGVERAGVQTGDEVS